jgi:hypothetical protein
MPDHQIGTTQGVQAVSNPLTALLLSEITADGANTVTISDLSKIVVGQQIDLINKSTGAVLAATRQVTNLTSAGVLTYDGADAVAVPGTHGVYPVGAAAPTSRSNQNGGRSDRAGWRDASLQTIQTMFDRLQVVDATYYTTARLLTMTYNDLVYAIRQADAAGSIK